MRPTVCFLPIRFNRLHTCHVRRAFRLVRYTHTQRSLWHHAPMPNPPFTLEELQQAMQATHHRGIWDVTPELRAVITAEIKLFSDDSRFDFDSDSARNRETWALLGAVYTQPIEVGYRLAGGDPGTGII